MNYSDLPVPVMITRKDGTLISRNRLMGQKKPFASRRTAMTLLDKRQTARFNSLANSDPNDRHKCCEVFAFNVRRSYFAAFVLLRGDELIWIFSENLDKNRFFNSNEFGPYGINDAFCNAVDYILKFPNVTMASVFAKINEIFPRDTTHPTMISLRTYMRTAALIGRLVYLDEIITDPDSGSKSVYFEVANNDYAAVRAIAELIIYFRKCEPGTRATLTVKNGKASFEMSDGGSIKIDSVVDKTVMKVCYVRPYTYTMAEARAALTLSCVSELIKT